MATSPSMRGFVVALAELRGGQSKKGLRKRSLQFHKADTRCWPTWLIVTRRSRETQLTSVGEIQDAAIKWSMLRASAPRSVDEISAGHDPLLNSIPCGGGIAAHGLIFVASANGIGLLLWRR